jgi:pimeloyl-ACP methyl ester carboxylesterase
MSDMSDIPLPAEPSREDWAHHAAVVNGVRLHYVEAGAGPLVLLLHGFPESWYSWRHQIGALAAAGFRVLAPDLRGYNLSDKPAPVRAYRLEALTQDVAALIHHAGQPRAAVAGHDWGGVIAWHLATVRPELLEKLLILNAPHPAAFQRELRTPGQLWRSKYIFFFRLPLLPEALFRAGDFFLLRRMLRREPVRPGAFTPEDVAHYKAALARRGALTAALNYYRAAFRLRKQRATFQRPVAAPTLVIWGDRDAYLGPRLTEGLQQWVPHVRVEHLPDASHWVQNDAPERVNRLMLDFLRQKDEAEGTPP